MANRADSPVPGAPLRQRPVSAPSSDRTHLGTATVAQTGPDASRRVGMSRIGNTPTCRIPFGEIPMHRDQSALQASLDPYRWQCQDAPLCEFGNVRVGRHAGQGQSGSPRSDREGLARFSGTSWPGGAGGTLEVGSHSFSRSPERRWAGWARYQAPRAASHIPVPGARPVGFRLLTLTSDY